MAKTRIFISSVQKELAEERRALKDFVHNDPLLRQHFEVFLFEDLPARDQRTDEVYLDEVERCPLYVGVFGMEYGYTDAQGVSPTEREFDRATAQGRERLIYVKGATDAGRDGRMLALVRKAGDQLIRRRFGTTPELTAALYASLVDHMQRAGVIRSKPFDASACPEATLADLDEKKLEDFLRSAQKERNYPLKPDTPVVEALTHLNLLDSGRPSHAAVLLFAKDPQRFLITSEVKCMHYHGTEVAKPIPDYKIFKGTAFELVDQAVNFVMSKLAAKTGTRAEGNAVPVTPEIPREAVSEAIVNAVAHRDYASGASVQVMLFSDRLEVWNPGAYPSELTLEALRHAHASIPRNPLISEPMFLARYIEKAGTGTLDMISKSKEAGLAPPEFRQTGGQVVQVLFRPIPAVAPDVTPEVTPEVAPDVTPEVAKLILLMATRPDAMSRMELQQWMGLRDGEHFRKAYLQEALKNGLIEMTIPDKPQSRLQKYKLTPEGKRMRNALAHKYDPS